MKAFSVAIALAMAFPCAAQSSYQLSPEVCGGFAADKLMDTKNYMSSEYNYQQHEEMVCRNTQSNTSTKFGLASSFSAIINYAPAEGAGSMDFAHQKSYVDGYCRHIQKMSQDEKRLAFSSQQFGNNMRQVTSECLQVVKEVLLQRGGVFAYAIPNNTQLTEFLVSVDVRPNPVTDVELTGYSGSNTACTYNGSPVQRMGLNLNGATEFLCSKPHDEGTFLTLHTSKMADTHVRLPGRADIKILALQSQMDSMNLLLAQQANRQVVVDECDFPTGSPYTLIGRAPGIDGVTNMWNNLDRELKADCPAGKLMFGVHSGHNNGPEDRQFRFKCCSVKMQ